MDIPQMTLVTWVVVGAIAGFLASVITGSREGLVMMIVLGIVGAVVGGWLAIDVFHISGVTGWACGSQVWPPSVERTAIERYLVCSPTFQ